MYFLADITKKVPIYVHFVEKLQTFDLRAFGGSFCRKFGWGQFILFYDRALWLMSRNLLRIPSPGSWLTRICLAGDLAMEVSPSMRILFAAEIEQRLPRSTVAGLICLNILTVVRNKSGCTVHTLK